MNTTLLFLLAELVLLSLGFLIFLMISRSLKRKRLIVELRSLMSKVGNLEAGRQEDLQERLNKFAGLNATESESVSIEIIQSERNLFKVFAELLIGGKVQTVSSFDTVVYTVMDHYWELLARNGGSNDSEVSENHELGGSSDKSEGAQSTDISEEAEKSAEIETPKVEKNISSPDEMANKSGEAKENIAAESDDPGEPSRDDAFAEATASGETPKPLRESSELESDDPSISVAEAAPTESEGEFAGGIDISAPDDDSAEPTWDDAFTEAVQNDVDKAEPNTEVSSTATTQNDTSEAIEISEVDDELNEPTWDDAFSEALEESDNKGSNEKIDNSEKPINSVPVSEVSQQIKEPVTEASTEGS